MSFSAITLLGSIYISAYVYLAAQSITFALCIRAPIKCETHYFS